MTKRRLTQTIFIISAVAAMAAAICSCLPQSNAQVDTNRIRLALCREISGYFVIAGENYGFPIDIADSFARAYGRKFEVAGYMELDEIAEALESGECDAAAVLSGNAERMRPRRPSAEVYSTSYVLISWRGQQFDTLRTASENIGRGRLMVDTGFNRIDAYRTQIDSLDSLKVTISAESGFEKAKHLREGRCDWFICEKSEAQIVCYLNRGLQIYYEFKESTDISFVFRNRDVADEFREWFAVFGVGDDYADLEEFYFGEERVGKKYSDLRHTPTRVVGGISVWDEQIRKIAARDSVDWRLLSAIAYNESRFRGDAVSSRGAVGLMQIMPIVAVEFHLDTVDVDLADPEINITLASKLIRKTMRSLKFAPETDNYDRAAITVAVYHCGIGRMGEARRAVVEQGGNPDSWADVRQSLLDMGSPEYVAKHNIKGGTFRDRRMTVAYVKGVMDKYETYCEAVK